MSVEHRLINGVNYLHIHREVNGKQKQKFINISGLSAQNVSLKKQEAEQIDKEWRSEQRFSDPRMARFIASSPALQNIALQHLQIKPPTSKSDWSVQLTLPSTSASCARSITKYGLDAAIKSCFEILASHLGIESQTSMSYEVLESLYLKTLRKEYFNQYKASVRPSLEQPSNNSRSVAA